MIIILCLIVNSLNYSSLIIIYSIIRNVRLAVTNFFSFSIEDIFLSRFLIQMRYINYLLLSLLVYSLFYRGHFLSLQNTMLLPSLYSWTNISCAIKNIGYYLSHAILFLSTNIRKSFILFEKIVVKYFIITIISRNYLRRKQG